MRPVCSALESNNGAISDILAEVCTTLDGDGDGDGDGEGDGDGYGDGDGDGDGEGWLHKVRSQIKSRPIRLVRPRRTRPISDGDGDDDDDGDGDL